MEWRTCQIGFHAIVFEWNCLWLGQLMRFRVLGVPIKAAIDSPPCRESFSCPVKCDTETRVILVKHSPEWYVEKAKPFLRTTKVGYKQWPNTHIHVSVQAKGNELNKYSGPKRHLKYWPLSDTFRTCRGRDVRLNLHSAYYIQHQFRLLWRNEEVLILHNFGTKRGS